MKSKSSKIFFLVSTLSIGLSIGQSFFNEVQATGGGGGNKNKSEKDSSGHVNCFCNISGSGCKCSF